MSAVDGRVVLLALATLAATCWWIALRRTPPAPAPHQAAESTLALGIARVEQHIMLDGRTISAGSVGPVIAIGPGGSLAELPLTTGGTTLIWVPRPLPTER